MCPQHHPVCAHVGRQHVTPVLKQKDRKPTERNVNPLLFPARARTVKELVLTLPTHDKNVTMTKTVRANFTVRTGLALMRPKTHRNNELRSPNLPKQRFIIALPANTRVPAPRKVQVRGSWHFPPPQPHQGFTRGAIALHTPASSGQHSSPV